MILQKATTKHLWAWRSNAMATRPQLWSKPQYSPKTILCLTTTWFLWLTATRSSMASLKTTTLAKEPQDSTKTSAIFWWCSKKASLKTKRNWSKNTTQRRNCRRSRISSLRFSLKGIWASTRARILCSSSRSKTTGKKVCYWSLK